MRHCSGASCGAIPTRSGARVQEIVSVGIDGVVFNLPADDDDIEAVALAGETLTKALA